MEYTRKWKAAACKKAHKDHTRKWKTTTMKKHTMNSTARQATHTLYLIENNTNSGFYQEAKDKESGQRKQRKAAGKPDLRIIWNTNNDGNLMDVE